MLEHNDRGKPTDLVALYSAWKRRGVAPAAKW